MNKRYQVFVSSTFVDLKDERQTVIKTLLDMDHIPSGMEMFPATDTEQFEFIRRIIDDCDYYILVIGGRYGSVTPAGISYTEREYDYAVSIGVPVIVFMHGDPDAIPKGKSEVKPELVAMLTKFREKASTGRLVKSWKVAEELAGLTALAMTHAVKHMPAVGWVRADNAASADVLRDVNEVRKQLEASRAEVKKLQSQLVGPHAAAIPDIAELEEEFSLRGTYGSSTTGSVKPFKHKMTWREIFASISAALQTRPTDRALKVLMEQRCAERTNLKAALLHLSDADWETIRIQLQALGLTKAAPSATKVGTLLYWTLTAEGERELLNSRVVRRKLPA